MLSTSLGGGGRRGQATIAFSISFEDRHAELAYGVTSELVTLFLDENIKSTVLFLKSLSKIPKVHILPYHSLYASKLKKLGRSYKLFSAPKDNDIKKVKEILTSEGIEIYNN